jgi:hypothetical protein
VAEEQPQENDYRNRHTKKPEQKSSSHCVLHQSPITWNAERDALFLCKRLCAFSAKARRKTRFPQSFETRVGRMDAD